VSHAVKKKPKRGAHRANAVGDGTFTAHAISGEPNSYALQ
jgi:hypothetical protein